MAVRENDKNKTIAVLAEKLCGSILALHEGDETSIAQLVREYYSGQGYEFKHIDNHGYVWTKDGGYTFAIEDFDQFEVMELVEDKLSSQRVLDFSEYDGLICGLPYNLTFTIRMAEDNF